MCSTSCRRTAGTFPSSCGTVSASRAGLGVHAGRARWLLADLHPARLAGLRTRPASPRAGRPGDPDEDETATAAISTVERESAAWMTLPTRAWQPPEAPSFFAGVQFADNHGRPNDCCDSRHPTRVWSPSPTPAVGSSWASPSLSLRQIGPAVLLTHSHGTGHYGWVTAMRASAMVKAVVAFEAGESHFPMTNHRLTSPRSPTARVLHGTAARHAPSSSTS